MKPSKRKKKTLPEIVEPIDIRLPVHDWRHLARVLVYSCKAPNGHRMKLVALAAQIQKTCAGHTDVTENVTIRDARNTWCDLTSTLLTANLCPEIASQITQQIPV